MSEIMSFTILFFYILTRLVNLMTYDVPEHFFHVRGFELFLNNK